MTGGSFKLLLAISLANLYLVVANPDTHHHSMVSADFQSVNSYLTQINPLNLEQTEVVAHLLEAAETIESVGVETLNALNGEDNAIEAKFKPLLDGNIAVVLNILKNLVIASDCDEESRNFLLLVNKETFVGQFLNKYAQMMLSICLKKHLAKSAKSFEKSASKASAATFELLEELAIKMEEDKKLKHRQTGGGIIISDQGATNLSLEETLSAIKKVSLNHDLRSFALKLNRIFNARLFTNDEGVSIKLDKRVQLDKMNKFYQNYLVSPCQSVTLKLDTTLGPFARYRSKKFVISPELQTMQKVDVKLDYLLEISRICLEVEANKSLLWNTLKNMR